MSKPNTPTPRTDALAAKDFIPDGIWIAHAKKLERELAALTAKRDQLRAALADPQQLHAHCLCTLNEGQIAHLLGQQMTTICAERDQLRSDCENETKWASHYLAQSIADKARAERAEAELATERARLDRRFSRDEKSSIAHALDHLIENKVADEGHSGGWYCGNRKQFEERHRKSLVFMRALLLPNKLTAERDQLLDELATERARLDYVLKNDCAWNDRSEIDQDIKNIAESKK